jgi:DNA-binding NarL/FixJ family response regulator
MARVLICDDHPVVRDAITVCLRAIVPDCEVALAATARQAIDRLAEPGWWDLVVLDLGLPDARGLDALIRVRAKAPETKVAVLSATDDRETVDRVLRAGAAAFVPKSADRETLFGSLQRLLGVEPPPDDAAAPRMRHDEDTLQRLAGLSPRQMQVLRLMVRGLPNKEICRELGLSENTVKIHIGAVLRTLQARNRTEAVALATRVGFGGH